jgi:hypothetical protein
MHIQVPLAACTAAALPLEHVHADKSQEYSIRVSTWAGHTAACCGRSESALPCIQAALHGTTLVAHPEAG